MEKEELGDNHISEDIEKVGWGVEEAQQAHTADASKSTTFLSCCPWCFGYWCQSTYIVRGHCLWFSGQPASPFLSLLFHRGTNSDIIARPRNPTRTGLRYTQKLHFCTRPAHGRCDAQGRQNVEVMGLADWKEKAQDAQNAQGILQDKAVKGLTATSLPPVTTIAHRQDGVMSERVPKSKNYAGSFGVSARDQISRTPTRLCPALA